MQGTGRLGTPNGISQSVIGVKANVQSARGRSSGPPKLASILVRRPGLCARSRSSKSKSLFLQEANWMIELQLLLAVVPRGRCDLLGRDLWTSSAPCNGVATPLGYFGSYAGFGNTEGARAAVKYRLELTTSAPAAALFRSAATIGDGTDGIYGAT